MPAEYVLAGEGRVRFKLGACDRSKPLTIDPVITYSTYVPNSVTAVAANTAGEVFIAGIVEYGAVDFPVTPGAYDTTPNDGSDAFLMKLDASGGLVYATYFGGNSDDEPGGIALDSTGNIYIAGSTLSTNYPVTRDMRPVYMYLGTFVTKFNPSGAALLYSTVLPGGSISYRRPLAVDGNGFAYVATEAWYDVAITGNAFRTTASGTGNVNDLVVSKLSQDGTQLLYSTYLGGNGDEIVGSIAVDSSGCVYVTGSTYSDNFPISSGAFQTTRAGNYDAFVTKLDPSKAGEASLIYSTYLGGAHHDRGNAIAVDILGNVYLAGATESNSFPTTPGAYWPIFTGQIYGASFVTKVNPLGTGLVYSTYLGGGDGMQDGAAGIAIDGAGRAVVAGTTVSGSFPVTPDAAMAGGIEDADAYLAVFDEYGETLLHSMLIGGIGWDAVSAVAYNGAGNAFMAGVSGLRPQGGFDFPVTADAFRRNGGASFLVRVDLGASTSCAVTLSAPSASVAAAGGTGFVNVIAPTGCGWRVRSFGASASMVTITGSRAGFGDGRVDFSVGTNMGGGPPQTYSVEIGNVIFPIHQSAGTCADLTVAPSPVNYSASGGMRTVQVTALSGCPWQAVSLVPWVTVTGGSPHVGPGSLSLYAERNWFGGRTGTVLINSQPVTVTQAAGSCVLVPSSSTSAFPAHGGTGGIPIAASASDCFWRAWSPAPWISIGTPDGAGSSILSFIVMANPLGPPRSAPIFINDLQIMVNQAAGSSGAASSYWISTYGGTGEASAGLYGVGDGGYAAAATIGFPGSVVSDSAGNLLVADTYAGRIRKISPDGIITTLAGGGNSTAEGAGVASASLVGIRAITIGPDGLVYYAETRRVRRIASDDRVYTVAGSGSDGALGDGGPALAASLDYPTGLAFDTAGNLYIADSNHHRVRRVGADGIISTVAGGTLNYGDGVPATSAKLNLPVGVALDGANNLYISDSAHHRIRKVDGTGYISTIAGIGFAGFSGDGGQATAAMLSSPGGIRFDHYGNLLIADSSNHRIRRLDGTGTITSIAGNGILGFAGDGGRGVEASLALPNDVTSDAKGDLFIADSHNSRIRLLSAAKMCTYTVDPAAPPPFLAAGGDLELTITTQAGCAWSGISGVDWLTPTSTTVIGSGVVRLQVQANASGAARSGIVSVAGRNIHVSQRRPGGDFNGDGVPDLVWQKDATRQVTVNYYGGIQGAALQGWNWLNAGGAPGWRVVAAADFDGNGVPDPVWLNDTTRQVTVNYYGGFQGAAMQGWNWLNSGGAPGWRVVAAADFDGNGVPDLVWQNDTTRQVTVNYYGGPQGAVMQGWNWLNAGGAPGWRVVAAADFDGNGVPDLVWQDDTTRRVTVNYYGGPQGAVIQGWNWLNAGGAPGWKVVGAGDFDANGVPDLAWQNDTTRRVTVNYYGGPQGASMQGWNWLNAGGALGWNAIVPG